MDAPSCRVPQALRQLLSPVIQAKCLKNDQLWREEILPQTLGYLQLLQKSIGGPASEQNDTQSQINIAVSRIMSRLNTAFSEKAPYTIHRLVELLLSPEESGYSSVNAKQMLRYLSAILRVVSVSSSESRYLRQQAVSQTQDLCLNKSQVSSQVYEQLDLPSNICFVPLDWGSEQTKHAIENSESGDDNKRSKVDYSTTEALEFDGISSNLSSPTANDYSDVSKVTSNNKLISVDSDKSATHNESHTPSSKHIDETEEEKNRANAFPAQLLSPLNTEKTAGKESASSTFEDGSMGYETPPKKHNEELRV